MSNIILEIKDLEAFEDSRQILHRVNFNVEDKSVLSIIGPRGSGKSTLLRCLNRIFEERSQRKVTGQIYFEGHNIYSNEYEILKLRREISMLFSEPTCFDHLTVFENVALGLRLNQIQSGAEIGENIELVLKNLEIWNELKDSLHQSPHPFSLGVKQLICLARILVLKPKVILMDESTSVVGLQKTFMIEQFIREISKKTAIILTTSSRKQAARISDRTAFLLDGELIEIGKTSDLFMNPQDHRTEDYLTGRFG
jgi:phosphate transport system ATP-binding protein